MAKNRKDLAESLHADESGGWLTGFLADEDEFDRRTLWRLGSWGVGSVGAVIIAILANQSGGGLRHEQVAAADLARQSQQLRSFAKTSENETRRLAAAVDTLNSDRDRLYARVTVLEQGLDSVTGSINRKNAAQNAAPKAALGSPQAAASTATQPDGSKKAEASESRAPPSPVIAPVASSASAIASETVVAKSTPAKSTSAKTAPSQSSLVNSSLVDSTPANSSAAAASPETPSPATAPTPAKPQIASKPAIAPQDPPAAKPGEPDDVATAAPVKSEAQKHPDAQIVVASIPAAADAEPAAPPLPADMPVAHTEFGVDLGSASSINGLRALWRNILKSNAQEVASLRPIIVLKERSKGLGMQLRLVAGPLIDAAAAAKICAVLSEKDRNCETSVFDGQRLAMKDDAKERGTAVAAKKPKMSHASSRHRHNPKTARVEEPLPAPPPPPSPSPKPSTFSSFFSR